MSYYKYAERSSESRVDWNEISKGMVDMLKEQTRLRNEKLDDALELQNTITTTLSEAPMGSDESANQRISGFASDAQEYMLMMNKLWRSGEMSYREYMSATNNFKTNANGYLTQAERYNEAYEVHQKRIQEQLASGVEVSELARVEDFGNFSKFTPVIDAPTGSIGLVDADGKSYASVTQLGVAVMSQYDRLDVNTSTTELAKQMENTIKVLKRNGVRTLKSALQNEDYLKAEDNAVSSVFVGDNSRTSVLVDYDAGAYDTTHDINDAISDPNAILMVPSSRNSTRMIGSIEDDAAFERYIDEQATRNGQPLTEGEKSTLRRHREAQRERSTEAVREQLRARLPWEETPTADRQPPKPSDREKAGRSSAETGVNNLQAIYTATDDTKDKMIAAINYFEGLNEGLDLEVVTRGNKRTLAIKREGEDETRYVSMETDYPTFVESVSTFVMPNTQYLSSALEDNPLPEGATRGTALGGVVMERDVDLENIGAEVVTYDEDGDQIETTFRGFMEGLPVPESDMSNEDDKTIFAVNEINSALDQLNLTDKITVSSVVENTLEDLYGRTLGMSPIDYPGIKIQAPNMPNGILISHEPNDVNTIGPILELIATGRPVTMEELYALMGDESIAITNKLIEGGHLDIEQPEIPNPNAQTASGGNVR